MKDLIFKTLGWIGMVLILAGVIAANYVGLVVYNVIAIVGGICLFLNAYYIKALPFIILNIFYTILGIIGLISNLR